jgi:hypothetical protein
MISFHRIDYSRVEVDVKLISQERRSSIRIKKFPRTAYHPTKIHQMIAYPITVLNRQHPMPADLHRSEVFPPHEIPRGIHPSYLDYILQCPNGEIVAPSKFQKFQLDGKRGSFGQSIDFAAKIEFGVGETGAVYAM